MEKLEMIYSLQNILTKLKEETDFFESNLKELLLFAAEKRFLSDSLIQSTIDRLKLIGELGERCREEYRLLGISETLPEYLEQMSMELVKTEQFFKEKEVYFYAKEEFLRLHSMRPMIEEQLAEHKVRLIGFSIEDMTGEETKEHLEKYVIFMKAWREDEPLKLIDYVQKLLEVFTKELVAVVTFQKEELFLEEVRREETVGERREGKEGEGREGEEIKQEKLQDHVPQQKESEQKRKKDIEFRQIELKQKESEDTDSFLENRTLNVMIESNLKKEKKFGVKDFKNDISGLSERLRKKILVEAGLYGGITAEVIAAMTEKPQKEVEQECEILLKYGYMRKYTVKEMGKFYGISPKGRKAFEVWDAINFLNIKFKMPKWKAIEDANHMESAAVTRMLLLKALSWEVRKRGFGVQTERQIEEYVFFLKCKVLGKNIWSYYTGISEKLQDESEYLAQLKAFVKEKGKLVIIGKSKECAEMLKEVIVRDSDETIEKESVFCYSFYEDMAASEAEEEAAVSEEAADIKKQTEEELSNNQEQYLKEAADSRKQIQEESEGNRTEHERQEKEEGKQIEEESKRNRERQAEEAEDTGKQGKEAYSAKIILEENRKDKWGEEWKRRIIRNYQDMIVKDKIYCATAYLYAAAKQNKEFWQLYHKLAYAVNDPLGDCSYSSGRIFDFYFDDDSVFSEYCMVSAVLRNYFTDHMGYDYQMQQLYEGVKERRIVVKDRHLGEIIYGLLEFKEQTNSGIDKYADYRRKDTVAWKAKVEEKKNEAKGIYENYVLGKMAEQASHRRFVETKKLIFSQEGDFAFYLKVVSEDKREYLQVTKEYLQKNFIKEGTFVNAMNLEGDKIHCFLDEKWEESAQYLRVARKSSDLMSSLRMNLYNHVRKALSSICDWVYLLENKVIDEKEKGFGLYKNTRDVLIENMNKAMQNILAKADYKGLERQEALEEIAGRKVLFFTLGELKARLEGSDQEKDKEKYFYIKFLANDKVLLNEEYRPDMDMEGKTELSSLPGFSLTERIELHAAEDDSDLHGQMKKILDGEDDYGSARLLERYFADRKEGNTEGYNIEEGILYAEQAAKMKRDGFVENLKLAQSYGQMENFSESKKEEILQAVDDCYEYAVRTKNFGYFSKVLLAFQVKIKEEAKSRESSIEKEMEAFLENHGTILEDEHQKEKIEKIQKMIEVQNYTVAEDLLNRLIDGEEESELELLKTDYLQDFLKNYDYNYANVSDMGKKLYTLLMETRTQKERKGGRKLLESWLSNGGGSLGEQKLASLLDTLGFFVERVKGMPKLFNKIENYQVILKKSVNGRKISAEHPIAPFGSLAAEEGFRIVCLYGKQDASGLISIFKKIGNEKHTIVLLDYPLSHSERRKLARMAKAEGLEKIFGVIDRVLLVYLVNNYTEESINRMLMAVMMPYTYYQPYVTESANRMPPEIFIGRKEELSKIESPVGVNIVYGGKQLGKTALLCMAKYDVDRNENGDRAVLVNIRGMDYHKTAVTISQELAAEGIFKKEFETDDWDKLAEELKKRLQSTSEEKIPYLLLLLDEADTFIESCEAVHYHPFEVLKDVQEIGTGRFKFVAAGLHHVIRLKQSSALGDCGVLADMESLPVTPFKVMEAKELLQIPLFYLGLRFPKEKDSLVSMILAATNYFPGLLQLYCAKLLEAMKKNYAGYNEKSTPPYEVQENHMKKVLSEEGFQQKIHEKFMVTLKPDEDDSYYIIALLIAYIAYKEKDRNGYTSKDVLKYAKEFEIKKMKDMQPEQIEALMEEMREFHVLRLISEKRYWFTRNNFFQMMGTVSQMEVEIMKYMEE